MQTVSKGGDNFHEMSNPILCKKYFEIFQMLSAITFISMLSIKQALNAVVYRNSYETINHGSNVD